jgi:hypothetical protein
MIESLLLNNVDIQLTSEKTKGAIKMDNPETQATLDTQDTERRPTKQKYTVQKAIKIITPFSKICTTVIKYLNLE